MLVSVLKELKERNGKEIDWVGVTQILLHGVARKSLIVSKVLGRWRIEEIAHVKPLRWE